MTYASGSIISVADYNQFANYVNELVNDIHSGDYIESSASFGYGQNSSLPILPQGAVVRAAEWDAMVSLIKRAADYQGTTIGSLPAAINIGDVAAAITTLSAAISSVRTNKLNITSANLPCTVVLTSSRSSVWIGTISYEFTMGFNNWDSMRYFFNSGGYILFSGVKQGTSVTPDDGFWQTLLSQIGDITFNYSNTTKSGILGNNTTMGFYDLNNNSASRIFEATVSGNTYAIDATLTAAPGLAKGINFTITYTSPGVVNGTITQTISEAYSNSSKISIAPGVPVQTYALEDKIISGTSVDTSALPTVVNERDFNINSYLTLGDTSVVSFTDVSAFEPESLYLSGTKFNKYVLNVSDGYEYLTASDSFATITVKRDPANRKSTNRDIHITTTDISSSTVPLDVAYAFDYEIVAATGITTRETIDIVIKDSMPNWVIGQLLDYKVPTSTTSFDLFGYSVDINGAGDFAVIGAPGRNNYKGSASIYQKSLGKWTFIQEITGTETKSGTGATPQSDGCWFGHSVSISTTSNVISVGSPNEESSVGSGLHCGCVYIFVKNQSTGLWEQTAKVLPSTPTNGGWFGFSVAINSTGLDLAVGAPFEDHAPSSSTAAGATYIFQSLSNVWTQLYHFVTASTDPVTSDRRLGYSVSITDAVGASMVFSGKPNAKINGVSIGKVEVYKKSGASTWALIQDITAPNTSTDKAFGVSVDVSTYNNFLVVGSALSTNIHAEEGASYVYHYDTTTSLFVLRQTLNSSSPAKGINFGTYVSMGHDGRTIVVGSPSPNSLEQNVFQNTALSKPINESTTVLLPAGSAFGQASDATTLSSATITNTRDKTYTIMPTKIFGKYHLGYQVNRYTTAGPTVSYLDIFIEGLHSDALFESIVVTDPNYPEFTLTTADLVNHDQIIRDVSVTTTNYPENIFVSQYTRWSYQLPSAATGQILVTNATETKFTYVVDPVVASSSAAANTITSQEPNIITEATIVAGSTVTSGVTYHGFSSGTSGTWGSITVPANSLLAASDYTYMASQTGGSPNNISIQLNNTKFAGKTIQYLTLEGTFIQSMSPAVDIQFSGSLLLSYGGGGSQQWQMNTGVAYSMITGNTYTLRIWDKLPASSHYSLTPLSTPVTTYTFTGKATSFSNGTVPPGSGQHGYQLSTITPGTFTIKDGTTNGTSSSIISWSMRVLVVGQTYETRVSLSGNFTNVRFTSLAITDTDSAAIGTIVNATAPSSISYDYTSNTTQLIYTSNIPTPSPVSSLDNISTFNYKLILGSGTTATSATFTSDNITFKNTILLQTYLQSANLNNGASSTLVFLTPNRPLTSEDIHDISVTYADSANATVTAKEIITPMLFDSVQNADGSYNTTVTFKVLSRFLPTTFKSMQMGFNEGVKRYQDTLHTTDVTSTTQYISGYVVSSPSTPPSTALYYKKNLISKLTHGSTGSNSSSSWTMEVYANIPQSDLAKIEIRGLFAAIDPATSLQTTSDSSWVLYTSSSGITAKLRNHTGNDITFSTPVQFTPWSSTSGVTKFIWNTSGINGALSTFPTTTSTYNYEVVFYDYNSNMYGMGSHLVDANKKHIPIKENATTNSKSYWDETGRLTGSGKQGSNGGDVVLTNVRNEVDLLKILKVGNFAWTQGSTTSNLVRWSIDVDKHPNDNIQKEYLKEFEITGYFESASSGSVGSPVAPVLSATKRTYKFVLNYPSPYSTTTYPNATMETAYTVTETIYDVSGTVTQTRTYSAGPRSSYPNEQAEIFSNTIDTQQGNDPAYPNSMRYVMSYDIARAYGSTATTLDGFDRVSPGQTYEIKINGKGIASSVNSGMSSTTDTIAITTTAGVGFVEVFHKDTKGSEPVETWSQQKTLYALVGDSGKMFGPCAISQQNDDIVVGSTGFSPPGGDSNGKAYFYGFANIAPPSVTISGPSTVVENTRSSISNYVTGSIAVSAGDNPILYEKVIVGGVENSFSQNATVIESVDGTLEVLLTTPRTWKFTPYFGRYNFDDVALVDKDVKYTFNYQAVDSTGIKTTVPYTIYIKDGQQPSITLKTQNITYNKVINGIAVINEGSDPIALEKVKIDSNIIKLLSSSGARNISVDSGTADISALIPPVSTTNYTMTAAGPFTMRESGSNTTRYGFVDVTEILNNGVTPASKNGLITPNTTSIGSSFMELSTTTNWPGQGGKTVINLTMQGELIDTFTQEIDITGIFTTKGVVDTTVKTLTLNSSSLLRFFRNNVPAVSSPSISYAQWTYSLNSDQYNLTPGKTYTVSVFTNNIYKNFIAGSYKNVTKVPTISASGLRSVTKDHVVWEDGLAASDSFGGKTYDLYFVPTWTSTSTYTTVYLRWDGNHGEKDIFKVLITGVFGSGTTIDNIVPEASARTISLTVGQGITSGVFTSSGYTFTPYNTSGSTYTQWSWKNTTLTGSSVQYRDVMVPGNAYSVSITSLPSASIITAGEYDHTQYTGDIRTGYETPNAYVNDSPNSIPTLGHISYGYIKGRPYTLLTTIDIASPHSYASMQLYIDGSLTKDFISSFTVDGVFYSTTGQATRQKLLFDASTTPTNAVVGTNPRDSVPRLINFYTNIGSSTSPSGTVTEWRWDLSNPASTATGLRPGQMVPGNSYSVEFNTGSTTSTASIYSVLAGSNYIYGPNSTLTGVTKFNSSGGSIGVLTLLSGPDMKIDEMSVSSNDNAGNTTYNYLAANSAASVQIKNFTVKGLFRLDGFVTTAIKEFSVTNSDLTASPNRLHFASQKASSGWIDPLTLNSWIMVPGELYDLHVNVNDVLVENLTPAYAYRVLTVNTTQVLNNSVTPMLYEVTQQDKDVSSSLKNVLNYNCGKSSTISETYTNPSIYTSGGQYWATFSNLSNHASNYVFSYNAYTHADTSRDNYGTTVYGFKPAGTTTLTIQLRRNPSGEWMAYYNTTLVLTEVEIIVDGSALHPKLTFFCQGPGKSPSLKTPATVTVSGLPTYGASYIVTFDWNYPNYSNSGITTYATGNKIYGTKPQGATSVSVDFNLADTTYDTRNAHNVYVTNAIMQFSPMVTCPVAPASEVFSLTMQTLKNTGGVNSFGFDRVPDVGLSPSGSIVSSQQYLSHGNNPILTEAAVYTTGHTTQQVKIKIQGDYTTQPTFINRIVMKDTTVDIQAFDVSSITVSYDSSTNETIFIADVSPIYTPFDTYSNASNATVSLTLYYG